MDIKQPMVQLGMLLFGLGMLWWEVRSIRRKVAQDWEAREMILAHSLKLLFGGAVLTIYGVLLLLASAGLISWHTAHYAITGAIFLALFPLLYLLVSKAPSWVWCWLGSRKH